MVLGFDATGPLYSGSNFLYRIITSREQGDTFRDFVKNDRWFVAPSIAWKPDTGTDLVFSFEFVRDQQLLDSGVVALNGRPSLPRDRYLGEPGADAVLAFFRHHDEAFRCSRSGRHQQEVAPTQGRCNRFACDKRP